jgi:hypothetical protein
MTWRFKYLPILLWFPPLVSATVVPVEAEKIMPEPDARPTVDIRYVDIRRGKPPSATLYFDVHLRNPRLEQRWFLLPRSLDRGSDISRAGGVTSADIYEYGTTESGIVRLGDFRGNGGFAAVLLPAGADVSLRRFAVSTMQTSGQLQPVSFPSIIVEQVVINGEPAETWFGGNAVTAKIVEIEADAGRKAHVHGGSNITELKVSLVSEERFTLEVPTK